MKNDPIIHAPLSKIVEAIINEIFGSELPETSRVQWHRDRITEALASLGGEDDNEITPPRIFKWLQEQNYQKKYGEQEYIMYYGVDMPRIINDAIKHFLPHSSEREVLEGFKDYMNKIRDGNEFHIEIDDNDIDDYLEEKQSKTETK